MGSFLEYTATPFQTKGRAGSLLLALALIALLAGCADLGYYLQSAQGHLKLMQAARPVSQWLADDDVSPNLKERLALAQRMRQFAVARLGLPDNPSYKRYADLQRRSAVWNVVAAPKLSLTLKTWCFPVAGCVGYRGYFDESQARAEAARLKAQGLEVSVYGVPAYSTLGWMNWAGGDPLLNTFIHYPEGELARMIFHELAHQVLYVKDDTLFNESFATAVERLGGEGWLADQGSDVARRDYAEFDARRRQFRALCLATRQRLAHIYKQNEAQALEKSRVLAMKNEAMRDFRDEYARVRLGWKGYAGYDAWVASANNASFGAQAAYDEWVPAFEALFVREGKDWSRFYDVVRQLANLPVAERTQVLQKILTERTSG